MVSGASWQYAGWPTHRLRSYGGDFDLYARLCFTHNALTRMETHVLPCTDADTNTRGYTLVYEHHTDRHTLTATQIDEGTHFPDMTRFRQTFASQTEE